MKQLIVPDQPLPPVTTIQINGDVTISWDMPEKLYASYKTPKSYLIVIKNHSGTWAAELTNCDGNKETVIKTKSCTIPLDNLMKAPFYLEENDLI